MPKATMVGGLDTYTVEVERTGRTWTVRARDASEACTIAANIEWMRDRRDGVKPHRIVCKVTAGKVVHRYRFHVKPEAGGLDHVGWSD